jgi:hypothetical protein
VIDERAEQVLVITRGGTPPRGLDTRPRLRWVATILWSSFLGASFGLLGILLMPEGWLDTPVPFRHLALTFAFLFVLAFVAAGCQSLLMSPRLRPPEDPDAC